MTWCSNATAPRRWSIQVSQVYLAGAEIDFVDDLIGQSFKIKNPNATSSCGCGTSFSI